MRYARGLSDCVNTELGVTTRLLDRAIYPNGSMTEIVRGVTPFSRDDVVMVHFNWLEGHDAKVERHVNAGMWMLDERGACMYDYYGKRDEKEKEEEKTSEGSNHHHHHHQALRRRQA